MLPGWKLCKVLTDVIPHHGTVLQTAETGLVGAIKRGHILQAYI